MTLRLDRDLGSSADEHSDVTEDLGGGFAILRSAGREPIIVATALAGTGALGFASPVSVDARLDADAIAWLADARLQGERRFISLAQIHSATCVEAQAGNPDSPEADAVWTGSPDDTLIIRTADCAAVWLVDPENSHLAMLHAGWRGAADGIVEQTVATLREDRGDPQALVAAIGPHIGPCCFEVGPDVAQRFADIEGAVAPASMLKAPRQRSDSVSLDLAAVLVSNLLDAGVPRSQISVASACTLCYRSPDGEPALHSYRRNGSGGPLMGSVGFLQR
jgi:YfiH family protein